MSAEKWCSDNFVSVIIPNYNYEKYIGEAIKSVLAQTYRNFEVIVVDDGSTDNSLQVIRSFGDSVRLLQQENQHVSAARNTGIRVARGEWVALLDADDIWHPKKLELQLRELRKNPTWSYIAADVLPLKTKAFSEFDASAVNSRRLSLLDFLTVTLMSSSSAVIRKSCFMKVGFFDTDLRASEDRDMWWRLAASFRGGLVEAPLWRYRQHPEQLNRKVEQALSMSRVALDDFFGQHEDFRHLRRPAIAHYYFNASISHRDNGGSLWKAFGYGLISLIYYPANYHKEAPTVQQRLKSVIVTLLRISGLKKG